MVSQISPLYETRKVPIVSIPAMAPGDLLSKNVIDSLRFPSPTDPAQMIYTSGTTGRPKGVLTSHQGIFSQVSSLTTAWDWASSDHILSFLPLHHVHGNINVVTCALNSGARLTFHDKFDAKRVWSAILSSSSSGLSLLMAVPTVYLKLIEHYKSQDSSWQQEATKACSNLRLMVSGSMALPEHTLNDWKEISGQVLLERYGMTECGMILSNPLHGLRKPGFVGKPLPGVQVKVVDNELRVKSLGMFDQYFAKEKATKEAFDEDGWFRTGDVVEVDQDGDFKILGRASVDILKISGFKVSALDVENDLLSHPDILEVAAVGVEDKVYGQRIGIVFKAKREVSVEEIRQWAKDKMAYYKIPKLAIQVDEIPRNQMGKVNKKELVKLFN
jgi:malonyl-CoA/methylmalonyl-CoA synthetase